MRGSVNWRRLFCSFAFVSCFFGCDNTDSDFATYNKLMSVFTYEYNDDPGQTVATQETQIIENLDDGLIGDCDDFAFTLQYHIGGEVWYTFVGSEPHAVLVKDGIAFDFLMKPTRVVYYPYRLLFVIKN